MGEPPEWSGRERELLLFCLVVAAVSGKGWRKLGELFWRAFFYLTRKTL